MSCTQIQHLSHLFLLFLLFIEYHTLDGIVWFLSCNTFLFYRREKDEEKERKKKLKYEQKKKEKIQCKFGHC